MTEQRIAITGSSGVIGGALSSCLRRRGDTVIRIVRRPAVTPGEVTLPEARSSNSRLVETLATKSSLGLARMKELAAIADGCSLEEGLRRELEIVADYATSHDLQEGLTAFAEKRQPEFTGQ